MFPYHHKIYQTNKRKLILSALNNPISVITGYPGTGKSYLITYIVETLLEGKYYKKKDIAVLTPTGRAFYHINL
nr:AAA family ATPase [Mycoplasmopsis bovis]